MDGTLNPTSNWPLECLLSINKWEGQYPQTIFGGAQSACSMIHIMDYVWYKMCTQGRSHWEGGRESSSSRCTYYTLGSIILRKKNNLRFWTLCFEKRRLNFQPASTNWLLALFFVFGLFFPGSTPIPKPIPIPMDASIPILDSLLLTHFWGYF